MPFHLKRSDGGAVLEIDHTDFPIALCQVNFIPMHDSMSEIAVDRADGASVGGVDDASATSFEFDCV